MDAPERTGTGFVFQDEYLGFAYEMFHPESPRRLEAISRVIGSSDLSARLTKLQPLADPMPWIKLVHTERHISSIGRIPRIGPIAALSVAGGLAGVAAVAEGRVRNAFCALRPPGHHARNTGREEGFCYYNNVAIAARYAQQECGWKKVLIIDWDYHHGNGTEEAFYEDPSVLFFSTHNWHAYPGTGNPARTGGGPGKGYTINIHFGCGVKDAEIIDAFRTRLLPAAISFSPDLVLISAGFDSRQDDALGCFDITDAGFVNLTRIAMDIAHTFCRDRLVSLLEGGYNTEGLAQAVKAHVTTLVEYEGKIVSREP